MLELDLLDAELDPPPDPIPDPWLEERSPDPAAP
jgi:hypothetical protein